MSTRQRGRSFGDAMHDSAFDLTDLVIVGVVAVLVAALVGWSALASSRSVANAETVGTARPIATLTPTPTPNAARPIVDLIATPDTSAALAVGLAKQVGSAVNPLSGDGYFSTRTSYAEVATGVDREADLIVIVPAAADAERPPLEWQAPLARTVAQVERAAPRASILLVSPVAPDAQAVQLTPVRNAIRTFARQADQHFIDGVAHHWVGTKVDAIRGLPTADALQAAGAGIGDEAKRLLAG